MLDLLLCRPVFPGEVHGLQIRLHCCDVGGIACRTAGEGAGRPRGKRCLACDAKVRVSKCGGAICGVVIWLKDPINPATGKPFVDDKNPNPALAKRPMIGLPLFYGMRPAGPNKWSGQIYNADDGNTYASNISVSGPGILKVEGCVGALCGGETWSRSAR